MKRHVGVPVAASAIGRRPVAALVIGALVACSGSSCLFAGERQDRRELQEILDRVVLNQRGITKLATARWVPEQGRELAQEIRTDISTTGAVSYVKPWSLLGAKEVFARWQLREVAEPGTAVLVSEVDVQKNRVDITLRDATSPNDSRVRLWFEEGFAARQGPEAVLTRVGNVVKLDGPLGELLERTAGRDPMWLDDLRRAYERAPHGPEKLASGRRYLLGLEREIGDRRAWSRLLGRGEDVSGLESTRAAIADELARLSEKQPSGR